jgi:hypothetical protein
MQNLELENQLIAAGYKATRHSNDFISFEFDVPHGRFKGRKIEVALDAPQFPLIPPSGPYIKPHILPINGSGNKHPFDGIHDRKQPTEEFQYWSRPCNSWNGCEKKDIKTYIAFLRTLFDFE